MSDWENSASDTPAPKPIASTNPVKKKWEGEDEEDDGPVSDWEASSSEDDKKPSVPTPALPPKKKGTLKAKLAAKEVEKAARAAEGTVEYDSDEVLDPKEKARRDKQREVNADLSNAADLLGAAALGGTSSSELDWIISCQPRTKEDFQEFSRRLIEYTIKRHQGKPLYSMFLEHHVRELALPLRDVEVRKVASGLTTLANEKQKEQRERTAGKKKPKGAVKPALGSAKLASRIDTSIYEEALDDFGGHADDFM